MNTIFLTSAEVAQRIAGLAKEKRLCLNLSQQSLSERSGVSLGVLKKFEGSGKISLESLLKLAVALGCLGDFEQLFKPTAPETMSSVDDLFKQRGRKRGRQ